MYTKHGHDTHKFIVTIMLFLVLMIASLTLGLAHVRSFFDLLASSIDSLNSATTTLYFMPQGSETLSPGGTTSLDIAINTKVAINALGATIAFPKDDVDIVSISKEKSFFDLWTEDTAISEDDGEIRFSGGTTRKGGLIGTGTVLTVTLRAKGTSPAIIDFKNVQVYPSDASGKPIVTNTRSITYTIIGAPAIAAAGGGGGTIITSVPPVLPNPDLNGDGKINLADLSILTIKLLGPYDPRYDLNADGAINLGDISLLLSNMVR